MEKTSSRDSSPANRAVRGASFLESRDGCASGRFARIPLLFPVFVLCAAAWLCGCAAEPSKPAQADAKPAAPAIPDEMQDAARALLGSETQVLAFGDLAKTGKQQFLAVVAENTDGKWFEVLRCDEHLKNQKGYLGLTPLTPITGWRLQFEQSEDKGLQLYFTPLKGITDSHVLPIAVRWNPATKRYQSLDHNYEHFLLEAPSLETPRSSIR